MVTLTHRELLQEIIILNELSELYGKKLEVEKLVIDFPDTRQIIEV